ncbi:hypothetical protein J421_0348 [Gemmatirosa kalamazoonensis]|uniref:Curlin associated repeat-containing protein n=1 Tax=Gemmatirosa kalamazoonensis TaxID=861299 RepID=W0RC42_9BACT|nr:hypothetical protein [Gemmatirosa kalamazoonensis]AHG87885.1 hypothetical protein J421_0348 [Gemmatirosa kalamazoonensis]
MTRTLRSFGRQQLQAALVGAVALLGGRAAQAQWGQPQNGNMRLVFEWQGNVDRDTRINVGRGGVSVYGASSNESRGRFVTRGTLPTGNGTLYVQRVSGRGNVEVIQQPGYNSGDGIIRITDSQGGQGYYDIRAYWQSNGTVADRNGNGDWNSRLGCWDRNHNDSCDHDANGSTNGNGGWDRGDVYQRNGEVARGRGEVALDRNGNVVYDRRGQVVYERRGNQTLVRDRNGNVVFDRNGKPVYEKSNNGRRGRERYDD